ncbi:MAG: tail sheath stabilizer and completion protein, partial [Candidimonas sp.]
VEKIQVVEREFDSETGTYGPGQGQRYTVERYMPVPYVLTMEVDIWTSNMDNKLQLLEQILTLYNPSLDLQTSTNPIDWTMLTKVELQDSITLSDRQIPVGTDDNLDIARLVFAVDIWLSPPAKVKRQKIIHQIVTNIYGRSKIDDIETGDNVWNWQSEDILQRVICSPRMYRIRVEGNYITLLSHEGNEKDQNGNLFKWSDLFDMYGKARDVSIIKIATEADIEGDFIIGSFTTTNQPNKLKWTIDTETLPETTLDDINGVIDPQEVYPGNGLPSASVGQRYLVVNEVGGGLGSQTSGWGSLDCRPNMIIQYDGTEWIVSFDATDENNHFVHNDLDGKILRWTGCDWQEAIDGEYFPGYWRLEL